MEAPEPEAREQEGPALVPISGDSRVSARFFGSMEA